MLPRYKLLNFITMLYITVALCDILSVYRLTTIFNITIASGIFILPFFYTLEDIITEVYGYAEFRRIVWSMLAITNIFALIMYVVTQMPTPAAWQHKDAYVTVFGQLLRITIGGGCIAILAGAFINSMIISKWKILAKGRYFWLRSLGSSCIGQAIQNIAGCIVLYTGVLPIHAIIKMVLPLYIIQMSINFFIVFPSNIIVNWLKNFEKTNPYDNNISYNPFSLENKYHQQKQTTLTEQQE